MVVSLALLWESKPPGCPSQCRPAESWDWKINLTQSNPNGERYKRRDFFLEIWSDGFPKNKTKNTSWGGGTSNRRQQ